MCIRDRLDVLQLLNEVLGTSIAPSFEPARPGEIPWSQANICLLYTSDAADERSSVDLGGRRIIKKKNTHTSRSGELLYRQYEQNKDSNQSNYIEA